MNHLLSKNNKVVLKKDVRGYSISLFSADCGRSCYDTCSRSCIGGCDGTCSDFCSRACGESCGSGVQWD